MSVHTEPLCVSPSYIWQHIEIGYVQGMCDLLAPLLVILDDGEYVLLPKGWGAVSFLLWGRGLGGELHFVSGQALKRPV